MSSGQRPAADTPIDGQGRRGHVGRVDPDLPVPELAYIKVALAAVETYGAQPAQRDVTGGLHEALAFHHPLALVGDLALAAEGGEHRVLGLFDLEEYRVGVAPAH